VILGALLLVLIGSADLIRAAGDAGGGRAVGARRPARTRRGAAAVIAVVWIAVLVVAITGLGLAWWWALPPAVLALLWLTSTSANPDVRTATGIVPAVGVLLVLAASMLIGPIAPSEAGYLVQWHADLALGVVRELPLDTLVLAIGVVLFLVESSNIVVRAALRPAVEEAGADAEAGIVAPTEARARASVRRLWWRRAQDDEPDVTAPPVADLKGGRLIGPLERLLIVALTLGGALPIVAGILAAKGIVRFPEISNDGGQGSKAEYFLVGSLVSWSIAAVAVGTLWLSAHS
jgi:hypothetical protein